MPSHKIIKTLHWYFSNLNQDKTFSLEEDITYSKYLGELIGALPKKYDGLSFVCALSNEAGLTKEKEYEYVGRGFVDPFYRFHNNDDCFNYVYTILEEKEKADFSTLEIKRASKINREGFAALQPLVALVMVQYTELLEKEAKIVFKLTDNSLRQMTKHGFIAKLDSSKRVKLMPKSNFDAIHNRLNCILKTPVMPSVIEAQDGFFNSGKDTNPKMTEQIDKNKIHTENLIPILGVLAIGITVLSLSLMLLSPPLSFFIALVGAFVAGMGVYGLLGDDGVGLISGVMRVPA